MCSITGLVLSVIAVSTFAALQAIIEQHGAENIVFVDGWTGKGAICRELTQNLADYPALFDAGWEILAL